MFAHITHVLMIRLNRYEGVITGGTDHRMQDAIHNVCRYRYCTYCDVYGLYNEKHTGRHTVVCSMSTHDPGAPLKTIVRQRMQLILLNRETPPPFSPQECDRITRRDKGCVAARLQSVQWVIIAKRRRCKRSVREFDQCIEMSVRRDRESDTYIARDF